MRNVFSMDLYRMIKTKSTYILLAIYVGILSLGIFVFKTNMDSGFSIGLEDQTISQFVSYLLSGETTIFLIVIFIAMFINAEFNSGYFKNIMGDIPKKINYVVSKCLVVAIYTAIYVILGVVIAIIGSQILGLEELGKVSSLVAYAGMLYLLDVVIGIIMIMVTIALRNSAASTSIGIVYILLISSLLYTLVNYGADKLFHAEDFKIQEYLPYGNLMSISTASQTGDFIRAIVVALIFGVVAFLGSTLIVKRRDA